MSEPTVLFSDVMAGLFHAENTSVAYAMRAITDTMIAEAGRQADYYNGIGRSGDAETAHTAEAWEILRDHLRRVQSVSATL